MKTIKFRVNKFLFMNTISAKINMNFYKEFIKSFMNSRILLSTEIYFRDLQKSFYMNVEVGLIILVRSSIKRINSIPDLPNTFKCVRE